MQGEREKDKNRSSVLIDTLCVIHSLNPQDSKVQTLSTDPRWYVMLGVLASSKVACHATVEICTVLDCSQGRVSLK